MSFYIEIKWFALGNKEKVLAAEKEGDDFDFHWFVVMVKERLKGISKPCHQPGCEKVLCLVSSI